MRASRSDPEGIDVMQLPLPGRSRGLLWATSANPLEPCRLPLHLQTGVWSFVRLNNEVIVVTG